MNLLFLFGFAFLQEDEFSRAIGELRSKDASKRAAAEDRLRTAGAKGVPAILQALEENSSALRERVKAEVSHLSDRDWSRRNDAMKALLRLGRGALPPLLEYEAAGDPEVAWRVKAVIAELRGREVEEEREDQDRKHILVRLLGEAGDGAAIPALLRALSDGGAEVRMVAAEAMASLREHLGPAQAEEATELVLELLSTMEGAIAKSRLIRTLAAYRSTLCVAPLVLLLQDRSERNVHLKSAAIGALAAGGSATAVRTIVETLGHEEPYLRHAAAQHLGALAGDDFGFDARRSAEENRESVARFREWWEKKYGLTWRDP